MSNNKATQRLSLGTDRAIIYSGVVPMLKIYFNSTKNIEYDKEALEFRDKILRAVNCHDELVEELSLILSDMIPEGPCEADYYRIKELLKRAKGNL